MENKEPLMLINDLVVQFRSKGKKVKAIKGANLNIYEKETFAMVGESGSGKTTIGRAIVGIQPIKTGTVYMNNKIVIGQATNLYKLNKKIYKLLVEMETNTASATKVFEDYLDEIKISYFKFVENKKYNPSNGKIKNLPGEIENNVEDILEEMDENVEIEISKTGKKKIIIKNKESQLEFIKTVQTNNLKSLINIIRLQQISIRFVDQLDKYGEEITKDLHESVRSKLKHTHVLVRDVKIIANNVYEVILKIIETREKFRTNKFKSVKHFFVEYVKLAKELVKVQTQFINDISLISRNQIQNVALSAPIKKREKFKKTYNEMINLKRTDLLSYLIKKQNELNLKKTSGEEIDNKLLEKIDFLISNVWSFKTINFNAIENFFDILKNSKPDELNLNDLQNVINQFKKSDLEAEIIKYFEDDIKKGNFRVREMILLQKKVKSAKEIIKHNIVSNRELVNFWYELTGNEFKYSEQEVNEYTELLEFLKLPSINEIASNMDMLKKPTKKDKKQNKKTMQMIFQDPAASLNDRMPVEQIICEGIDNFPEIWKNDETRQAYVEWFNSNLQENQPQISLSEVDDKKIKQYLALNMLKSVGMLPEHLSRYPHEFSGGQRQRIGIARALVMKPKFIVADEPISALDVSIRAQVLNLLKKFQEELGLTYMFVAHDLSIVRFIADRIAVIYHGDIVEVAEAEELFNNPLHPYTRSLLSAIPHPDPKQKVKKVHYVYDPQVEHADYLTDYPNFTEVKPGHFVLCNQREEKEILNGGKN